jgi:hypothetical protein
MRIRRDRRVLIRIRNDVLGISVGGNSFLKSGRRSSGNLR